MNEKHPTIISLTNRYQPDHSGSCCPICAGPAEENPVGCGYCSIGPPHREEVFEYAKYMDEFPSICSRCIFPIRQADGSIKTMCWGCLGRHYSHEQLARLRECPSCYCFDEFEGKRCRWCRELGPLWSIYQGKSRPELTPEEKELLPRFFPSEQGYSSGSLIEDRELNSHLDTLKSLAGKGLISEGRCGARRRWHPYGHWMYYHRLRASEARHGSEPKKLEIDQHYDDIMAAVTTEHMVDVLFSHFSGWAKVEEKPDYETMDEADWDALWERENQPEYIHDALQSVGVSYWIDCPGKGIHRYLLDKRIDVLERHPRYGPYFRALYDDDIHGQIDFLWGLDPIPDTVLELEARKITTPDEFLDYLHHGNDFPPEFRMMILRQVGDIANFRTDEGEEINLNNIRVQGKLFLENFSQALIHLTAVQLLLHAWDPKSIDLSRYHNPPRLGQDADDRYFQELVSLLGQDSLKLDDPVTDYPCVNELARRGEEGICRMLARFLIGEEIGGELSLEERFLELVYFTSRDPVTRALRSIHQETLVKLARKKGRDYRLALQGFFYRTGQYREYLTLCRSLDRASLLFETGYVNGRYLVAIINTNPRETRKQMKQGIRYIERKIVELEKAEACGKALQIIGHKCDCALFHMVLGKRKKAGALVQEVIYYLEWLVDECERTGLVHTSYDHLLENFRLKREEMTRDLDSLVSCLLEMMYLPCQDRNEHSLGPTLGSSRDEDGNMRIKLFRFCEEKLLPAALRKLASELP